MDDSDMMVGLAATVSPFAIASVTYLLFERRFRLFWAGEPLPAIEVRVAAPYRMARVVPGHTQKAPSIVRWAALSCFFFGQMFLPGLFFGLFGLIAMGVGLVSIPGLIIAARLWAAGIHLLKGTPDAVGKARSAARWSVQLNALISVVCIAGGVFAVFAYLRPSQNNRDDLAGLLFFVALVQAYAIASFAQAALIARATRDLVSDEDRAREDVLPRWMRAALNRRDERRALT